MRIEKCYFCGSSVYPGHGITFVRNDAKVFRFCRSKCRKNFNLKRNPRKTPWTKAFRKTTGKDLTVDTTLEFEKKRNAPVTYDRELYAATVKAIKRVSEVRERRESSFWEKRMEGKKEKEKEEALKDLETNISLIRAPVATQPAELLTLPKVKVTKKTALKSGSSAKTSKMSDD